MDQKKEKSGLLRIMDYEDLPILITEVGRAGEVRSFRVYRKLQNLFDKMDMKWEDPVNIYIGNEEKPNSEKFEKYIYCNSMQIGLSCPRTHFVRKIE